MNYLVSVIVPIYNVDQHLKRCVDSIISQTYHDLEIVLVNDGSTDSCKMICDEYAKNDQRIVVIHKKNGGLSDARNSGLQKTTGEYVLFIDADDYIELDACGKLVESAIKYKVDIVVARAWEHKKCEILDIGDDKNDGIVYSGADYLKVSLKNKFYYSMVCLNLYRREFIMKSNIFFKFGIYHEDEEWMPKIFMAAKSVVCLKYKFYHYIRREGSITKQKSNYKSSKDILDIATDTLNSSKCIADEKLKKYLCSYFIFMYFDAFFRNYKYYLNHQDSINKKIPLLYSNTLKEKFLSSVFYINLHLFYFLWKIRLYIKNKIKTFFILKGR